MENAPYLRLKAIGVVRNERKKAVREGWEEVISQVIIDEGLTKSLDGLEDFSHVVILYWMHRVSGPPPVTVHPHSNPNIDIGLFASRAPQRPNPIGVSTVRLLERKQNILIVKGLDAIDGSPVIDIKPYLPANDDVADAKIAPWVTRR